jgi:hypothetical protein
MPRFAVAPVGGALGLNHINRHAQRDFSVDGPAASADLAVVVLGDDLIAEVSCRPGAGMRDQCLVVVEFQLEFLAQELRQLIFDYLGLGPVNPSR